MTHTLQCPHCGQSVQGRVYHGPYGAWTCVACHRWGRFLIDMRSGGVDSIREGQYYPSRTVIRVHRRQYRSGRYWSGEYWQVLRVHEYPDPDWCPSSYEQGRYDDREAAIAHAKRLVAEWREEGQLWPIELEVARDEPAQ